VTYQSEMKWVDSIMDVYFDLRPVFETQKLYRSKGLNVFHYWTYELDYLTGSTWVPDEEFRSLRGIEYILEKYPGDRIRLDAHDQKLLWNRFIIELGMNPPTFSLKFVPK